MLEIHIILAFAQLEGVTGLVFLSFPGEVMGTKWPPHEPEVQCLLGGVTLQTHSCRSVVPLGPPS